MVELIVVGNSSINTVELCYDGVDSALRVYAGNLKSTVCGSAAQQLGGLQTQGHARPIHSMRTNSGVYAEMSRCVEHRRFSDAVKELLLLEPG